MTRVCPRHRVEFQVVGDELRCPAAPRQVVGWLVVDRHGRVWGAATRKRAYLRFDLEWPVRARWELARVVERCPSAA